VKDIPIRIELLDGDLPVGAKFEYLPDSQEFVFSVMDDVYAMSVRLNDLQAAKLSKIIDIWGHR
jgi:hypothetical protein